MGIGSLLGATLMLPYARAKASPNALTILAGVILVAVLVLMAIVPNLWMFLCVTALAGISWTVSASELWIAGQRAMPDWARGRMNAVQMMASQGGLAVGSVLLGPRYDAAGRRSSFDGQSGVSRPAFDQLRRWPQPGSSAVKNCARVSVGAEGGGWARHGHVGANHSSGRAGKVPGPDERASADLVTQWGLSLSCRRIPRTSRHLPHGNAGQLLGRAPQTAQPHDKSRDRACGARLGDALGRARAGGAS